MTGGRETESELLARIRGRLERLSEAQHRLARNHHILVRAATQLRLGRSAESVLAEIREQDRLAVALVIGGAGAWSLDALIAG